MFGLSKKERYERKVEIALIAMLSDFSKRPEDEKFLQNIKLLFSDYWDSVIKDGVTLKTSPEDTAFCIVILFFKYAIAQASPEDLSTMRQTILDRDFEPDEEINLLFRLKFTFLFASRKSGKEIPRGRLLLALQDIHRAIFDDDDEKIDDTIYYLIKGGNHIAEQIKELQGVDQ